MLYDTIKNARAIVTVDDADRVLWNANILVDGCEINILAPKHEADRVIDAPVALCIRGLSTPSPVSAFAEPACGAADGAVLWLVTLYEIWRGLNDDCIYYSSLVGMGEL